MTRITLTLSVTLRQASVVSRLLEQTANRYERNPTARSEHRVSLTDVLETRRFRKKLVRASKQAGQ